MRTLDDANLSLYDFFDFGAGDGASLQRCEKLFGGRGLGIDNDPNKVALATERGADVVLGDITKLPRRKMVRYVCMDNFLEHLPDYSTAHEMLSVAAAVAVEFLYIVHPSFEDEAYLRELGLKQFWQDWTGHTSHLLVSDLTSMLNEIGGQPLTLEYVNPRWDSTDSSILPSSARPDSHHYDFGMHGPKPYVSFERPVHWQIILTAHLGTSGDFRIRELEAELARLRESKSVRAAAAWWRLRQRVKDHGPLRAGLHSLRGIARRRLYKTHRSAK